MQRRLLVKSVAFGLIAFVLYLIVVILTTPNFSPWVAASIALQLNGIYIVGISISVAVQRYIIGYGKTLGCELPKKRADSMSFVGSITSSFFSFFSLVAVGCCGTWLYILSFLPAIFGISVTGTMIRYSTQFAQFGLGLMILTNIYAYLTLRRKLKLQTQQSFLSVEPA